VEGLEAIEEPVMVRLRHIAEIARRVPVEGAEVVARDFFLCFLYGRIAIHWGSAESSADLGQMVESSRSTSRQHLSNDGDRCRASSISNRNVSSD
jgi:uncharacterized protein YycO